MEPQVASLTTATPLVEAGDVDPVPVAPAEVVVALEVVADASVVVAVAAPELWW